MRRNAKLIIVNIHHEQFFVLIPVTAGPLGQLQITMNCWSKICNQVTVEYHSRHEAGNNNKRKQIYTQIITYSVSQKNPP